MSDGLIQAPHSELQQVIRRYYQLGAAAKGQSEARQAFEQLLLKLESGELRAAEPVEDGGWRVNEWVKEGILLGFRIGELVAFENPGALSFVDKSTFPARRFSANDNLRIVVGGSAVRRGAFLASGVICMPPMYINAGAYVGEGSLVDSHALVGSCAQIGKRVHLSAAAQIGGVLEPVNAAPVIIEDDVMVGGNCGVYEGTRVRRRAVLAAGVVLTRGTPVYDLVTGEIHRANASEPLTIPENAVVVAGSRPAVKGKAKEWGIALYTPVIVKYRDEKTDVSVALEDVLR